MLRIEELESRNLSDASTAESLHLAAFLAVVQQTYILQTGSVDAGHVQQAAAVLFSPEVVAAPIPAWPDGATQQQLAEIAFALTSTDEADPCPSPALQQ